MNLAAMNLSTEAQAHYCRALRSRVEALDASAADYAIHLADALLLCAREVHASDIHVVPAENGTGIFWRVDGVLHRVDTLAPQVGVTLVARLKVMADLLTYRTDVPQEGRLRHDPVQGLGETRLSTFPTMYGEKAVIRLFSEMGQRTRLEDLGYPGDVRDGLQQLLESTSGAILVTGPSGSGKTTTVYACLREILNKSKGSRSLVSLEDPIEVAVTGVAQSHVRPSAGFPMAVGLRALLRQDPDVILVGEIRDCDTAEVVFQASLTGHLVLSTFHSGSALQAVSRLLDMGIEPYLLRSGLLAVSSQRLIRELCACKRTVEGEIELWQDTVSGSGEPVGCADCHGTGYRGRMPLAELLVPSRLPGGVDLLRRDDLHQLHEEARTAGLRTQHQRAVDLIAQGCTSVSEVWRVLADERIR